MSRREGGRRRLPAGGDGAVTVAEVELEGVGEGEGEGEAGARDEEDAEGVAGRDLALALERSTHGFSGGIRGTVYCATAGRERSQRLGAHTPTRTRQAATRRFALGRSRRCQTEFKGKCVVRGLLTDRSCLQAVRQLGKYR